MPFEEATTVAANVNRDLMDPCEDSGLDSLSSTSNGSSEKVKKENEGTIGEGIEFVDPALLLHEQQLKAEAEAERKRKISEEVRAKRLAEQEAYETEIKEKQYKALMHLLSKSKAMSNFIMKKFDTETPKQTKVEAKKGSKGKRTKDVQSPLPKKRSRKPNRKYIDDDDDDTGKEEKSKSKKGGRKLNLSEEEIVQELASISDEEPEELVQSDNDEKENTEPATDFIQPKYFEGQLRDYQKVGLNWLKVLYENGLNGILADEMGLGKTIQIIALFAYLIEKKVPGPYLVVVPLSTLANWTTEFVRFAPKLPVVTYYGYDKERITLRKKLQEKKRIGDFLTYPIVITTYEIPQRDSAILKKFNWRYIVVDEAQRIKNFNSLLFRILKSFNSFNRLLMTGTPLQNNLTELWSLLNFLLPEIFNNLDVFETWFDVRDIQNESRKQKFLKQEQEKHVLTSLREILQPFMLRRLKEDVCPDIPPIKEVIVHTPITAVQYDLYLAILNKDMYKLQKVKPEEPIIDIDGVRPKRRCTQKIDLGHYYSSPNDNVGIKEFSENPKDETEVIGNTIIKTEDLKLWNEFTEVTEKNIDYLIRLKLSSVDAILYRHVIDHPYNIHYPLTLSGEFKVDEELVKASGKMLVLDALLKRLHKNGHKVLLYSTKRMNLDLIEDYLTLRDFIYTRLDGLTKYEDRKNNIDNFQNNPQIFLFLLTTKAGAVGLNLAAADTVIIYDSDWNPQNDLQAMARCHRIGQTKPVVVYRLCTRGTIDELVIKRANAKRFLEKAVIAKESSLANNEEGLLEMKKLLDDCFKLADSKNQVYTDEELDELLDRSDMVLSTKAEELKS